jgi:hypothetical protein
MNSLLRLALVSVISILFAAPRGWAQNAPTIRILGAWSGSQQPAMLFQAIEAHLAIEPFDPEAEPLLRAADAFTKALFHLSDAKLDRSATYRGGDGDCVVASWRFGEPPNTLLVNDTPYQSIYSFRLGRARRVAADGLISFLQETIVFHEPPLKLNPEEFSIDVGPVSSTVLYFGGGTSTRSPYALVRDLHISGGTDGAIGTSP